MITARISTEAAETALRRVGPMARAAAADVVTANTEKLWNDAVRAAPGAALRASLRWNVTEEGDRIEGRVASDGSVPYARITEYGGRIEIPEITRQSARALAFVYQGKLVFAMHTRAHAAEIPAHPYLRPALAALAPRFGSDLEASLSDTLA